MSDLALTIRAFSKVGDAMGELQAALEKERARAEAAEARCVELVAELDESERTIEALKHWRDELQAQCALQRECLESIRELAIEFRKTDVRGCHLRSMSIVSICNEALSDTAQETGDEQS